MTKVPYVILGAAVVSFLIERQAEGMLEDMATSTPTAVCPPGRVCSVTQQDGAVEFTSHQTEPVIDHSTYSEGTSAADNPPPVVEYPSKDKKVLLG